MVGAFAYVGRSDCYGRKIMASVRVHQLVIHDRKSRSMLNDPLHIGIISQTAFANSDVSNIPSGGVIVARRRSTSGTGSSVYVGSVAGGTNKYSLNISHSKTNENKPFVTDRTLIRLDLPKIDPVTKRTVTLSAFLVVAAPQGDLFSKAEVLELTRTLSMFTFAGKTSEAGARSGSDDTLDRTLDGES